MIIKRRATTAVLDVCPTWTVSTIQADCLASSGNLQRADTLSTTIYAGCLRIKESPRLLYDDTMTQVSVLPFPRQCRLELLGRYGLERWRMERLEASNHNDSFRPSAITFWLKTSGTQRTTPRTVVGRKPQTNTHNGTHIKWGMTYQAQYSQCPSGAWR